MTPHPVSTNYQTSADVRLMPEILDQGQSGLIEVLKLDLVSVYVLNSIVVTAKQEGRALISSWTPQGLPQCYLCSCCL